MTTSSFSQLTNSFSSNSDAEVDLFKQYQRPKINQQKLPKKSSKDKKLFNNNVSGFKDVSNRTEKTLKETNSQTHTDDLFKQYQREDNQKISKEKKIKIQECELFISSKETHFQGSNSSKKGFYSLKEKSDVLSTSFNNTPKHLYVSPRFQASLTI